MLKKSKLEKICPICFAQTFLFHTIKDSVTHHNFYYLKCKSCGHIFISEILSRHELFINYPYTIFSIKGGGVFTNLKSQVLTFILNTELYKNLLGSKRFLVYAINLFKQKNTILPRTYLDYGCGSSPNLQYFKEINPLSFRLGYEESHLAQNTSNEKIVSDLKIVTKIKYDIISLFHVLEHVSDLDHLGKTLQKITSKNSIIIVQIPQSNGINMKFIPKITNIFHFHTPYHLHLFSRKSLEIFFKKYGFRIRNFNYEIYQSHSIVNEFPYIVKVLSTPLVLAYSFYAKITKESNVVTAYLEKLD